LVLEASRGFMSPCRLCAAGPSSAPFKPSRRSNIWAVHASGERRELVSVGYPVRRAAYDALLALGEKPEKPVIEREPTPREVAEFRQSQWSGSMKEILPAGWAILSVESANAPAGWKREAGDEGVVVTFGKAPRARVPAEPLVTVWSMPRDWWGSDGGERIYDRKVSKISQPFDSPEIAATYIGYNGQFHIFVMTDAHGEWAGGLEKITEYFGAKR
jgi:hypothetical protein